MFNGKIEELEPANIPKIKRGPLADKRGSVTCTYPALALSGNEMKSLRAAVVAGLTAKQSVVVPPSKKRKPSK